jgi:hypothetical protein
MSQDKPIVILFVPFSARTNGKIYLKKKFDE